MHEYGVCEEAILGELPHAQANQGLSVERGLNMWLVFMMLVPPFVALPFVFLLMPTAWGALLWQVVSTGWILFCYKKWM